MYFIQAHIGRTYDFEAEWPIPGVRNYTDEIIADVTFGITSLLLVVFLLQTWCQRQKVGFAHFLLIVWWAMQIPMVVDYTKFPSHYGDDNSTEIINTLPIHITLQQLQTFTIITVIWITISRVKRVEVQVVQDD